MKCDELVSAWTPFEELNSWNWQLNMLTVKILQNPRFNPKDRYGISGTVSELTHPCYDFPIGKSYNYRFLIVTINELFSIIRPFEASYGISFRFKIVWFQC